jgi:hypothetical protein
MMCTFLAPKAFVKTLLPAAALLLGLPSAHAMPIPETIRMSEHYRCGGSVWGICGTDLVELQSGGPALTFSKVATKPWDPDDGLDVVFTLSYLDGWVEMTVDKAHSGVISPWGMWFFLPTGRAVEVQDEGEHPGWYDIGTINWWEIPEDPDAPLRLRLAVPEPGSTALMLGGLGLLGGFAWRRRASAAWANAPARPTTLPE